MPLLRTLALLGVLAAPLCAQTTCLAPARPGTPEAARNGAFEIARNGPEARLLRTLPDGEARSVEIHRNTVSEPAGRVRIYSADTDAKKIRDTPADSLARWHWLKPTRPDHVIVDIGPVAAPAAPKT